MRRPLALLFLAAGLAAAAESTASGALFALAVGLALLIAGVGLAVVLAASRVRVTRTVLEREVVEGRPVRLRFQVAGIEWLPVTLEAEDGSGAWFELGRAGGLIEVTVGRRGAYRLLASRLRIRDSAGIFEWQLRAGAVEPLLILPSSSAPANLPPPHSLAGDPELDGLEDHVLGAPLARIHWPALARGAGLQVRRFSVASGALPLVVVDTSGARDVRAVDWAVRTAAGHILALTRRG
ncbi:MAG TPA: DUF58 domain-containing protein, partial [Solirubrobacteraceae bacterium]|nr:DUF58 domain-containing protein [Solirubrobacteraceae bacterium]